MAAATKIDLRFNDVKIAVLEIAKVLKNCPLTDEAVAVLVSDASGSRGVTKNQVLEVLKQIQKLDQRYLK